MSDNYCNLEIWLGNYMDFSVYYFFIDNDWDDLLSNDTNVKSLVKMIDIFYEKDQGLNLFSPNYIKK